MINVLSVIKKVLGIKRLIKDEKPLLDEIKKNMHFRCEDVLISKDHEYQALKEKKVCVDRRRLCNSSFESHLYLLKSEPPCGQNLSEETRKKLFFAKKLYYLKDTNKS